ncbi:MAG: hypothetical protein JXP34_12100 [Planctomycetes bacterium]|nr:hypothetical protein [Planctomycetota bacterium]
MNGLSLLIPLILSAPADDFDAALFRDPPGEYRPAPFWFWNDVLEEEELARQLAAFREAGCYHIMLHPRYGLGGPFGHAEIEYYLSPAYFDRIGFTIRKAKELGLSLWLYDDYNWPSGYGGGRVLLGGTVGDWCAPPNPEFRARHIARVETRILGPTEYYQEVPEGDVLRIFGIRRTADGLDPASQIDLTRFAEGIHFRWDAPDGDWLIIFFLLRDSTHFPAGKRDLRYVDLMSPGCVEKFIAVTHAEYERRFGSEFGQTIRGIFTDEPAYFNNNIWGEDPDTLPWTPLLFDAFQTAKGYDLAAALPALWYDFDGVSHRARADFWDIASSLYRDHFFRRIHDWCEARGIASTGHVLEETFRFHRAFEGGDFFRTMRFLHIPGIDQIGGRDFGRMNPKLGSSCRALFGRNRILSETFGAYGWDLTLEDLREILQWQIVRGVNLEVFHAFFYSTAGPRKHDAPPDLFYHNLWKPYFRTIADACGRLSYVASTGEHVADVAVIYPVSAIVDSGPPSAFGDLERAYADFEAVSDVLLEHQRDFNYVPESALYEDAGAEVGLRDGRLIAGRGSYSTVVIPPVGVFDLRALARLDAFAEAGGTVIIVRDLARRDPRAAEGAMRAFWDRIFGGGGEIGDRPWVRRLPSGGRWILTGAAPPEASRVRPVAIPRRHADYAVDWVAGFARAVRADVPAGIEVDSFAPELVYRHHRSRHRTATADIFLVVNESRAALDRDVAFRVPGVPSEADPLTGEVRPCATWERDGDAARIRMRLGPYGSRVFIFRADAKPLATRIRDWSGDLVSANDEAVEVIVEESGEAFIEGARGGRPFRRTALIQDGLLPIDVPGPFAFTIPGEPTVARGTGSWTDRHPRYSGWATYEAEVFIDRSFLATGRRIILDLGDVRHLAEVRVNGTAAGALLWAPYRIDVTAAARPGKNAISIRVANTWANAYQNRPEPSGLLGPVRLVPARAVRWTFP